MTALHVTPGAPVTVRRLAAGAAPGPAVPELALLLDRPLRGPGVTAAHALAAVATVHAALVTLGPDGEPAGWTVHPSGVPAAGLDLELEAVLVEVDGVVVDSAAGAAILGHPAEALAAAANLDDVEAGTLVLTGPLAAPAGGGAVAFHFTSLGSLFAPGSASASTSRSAR